MARQFSYDTALVVRTRQGRLRGYQLDGIHIFKGIPYARARRFAAPSAPDSWEGIRETASYGFVCPLLTQDKPKGELLIPHRYWPQDEACQNLNIWTPGVGGKEKLPVMVWLHGGGFSSGSAIEQKCYNGENMARFGNVVVVTVNHRLNILGYLDLSPYGSRYANSGNRGQEDLIAALRWIQENIAAFGGDPENVTIFGQSGGGMKVTALLQTPAADGLFHRGIVMSGIAGDLIPYSRADSRPLIRGMLRELRLTEADVEQLETVPYSVLAAAYNKVRPGIARQGGYTGCAPRPNDWYPGEGPEVGFTAHAKTVPLMIGTAFGEFATLADPFPKEGLTQEALEAALRSRFGDKTDQLRQVFRETYPGKDPADLMNLDTIFRIPTKAFIEAFAKAGGKAYPYLFSLEFPYQGNRIAWHCADIPFVFHNTDLVPIANIEGVTDLLEKRIFADIMAFARTGTPGWRAAEPGNTATMLWDRECALRWNFDDKLLDVYTRATPSFDTAAYMESISENTQH